MNDFTKEELINIRDFIKPPLWFYEKSNCELIKKIQSMIDNYCEHKKKSCMSCGFYSCDECENNE